MRHRSLIRPSSLLVALAITLGACGGGPQPSGSGEVGVCSEDLPARTSPTDFPVAVLHVNGEDLPPVVGEVEWLGGGEPVTHEPARPVRLERFTVLQTSGQSEVSMRLTDGVQASSWTVDVVPGQQFHSGDVESNRVRWSEGEGPANVVCIPIADGAWAVIAVVTFADEAGSGTYYWRLNVVDAPSTS